jgi:hypothetical protein
MTERTFSTPQTAKEALQQCELLWQELASTGSADKYTTAKNVLGYSMLHACPACEYAYHHRKLDMYCGQCPIDAWRGRKRAPCERNDTSPYHLWLYANSAEERKEYAAAVLNLVRNSEAYND